MADYEETSEKGLSLLNSLYDRAMDGVVGSKSVEDLANEYLEKANYDKEKAAKALVSNQVLKCTLSGAASGLGGLVTACVTLPANIVNVLYVQIRMIAAIAYIGGYDIKSDQVQTMVYAALIGKSVNQVAGEMGTKIATKVTTNIIKQIPRKALIKINKWIGFKLITKSGTKGVINLGKMVPFVGAAVGGTLDYAQTKFIARKAYDVFIKQKE